MALETLKGLQQINGEKVVCMDDLRLRHPEKFNESGAMDYKWFESEIRPYNFIYVRHDVNSVSFTIQNGPVKEVGKNGCQVEDIIAVAAHIVMKLNAKYPCVENAHILAHLDQAIFWSKQRTADRVARNVEGTSNA